jgi:hypothetical protein
MSNKNIFNGPELGRMQPHETHVVNAEAYPWINVPSEVIRTSLVVLPDETVFRYASLIRLNNTVERLAGSVPLSASDRAQTALFNRLPSVLIGNPTANAEMNPNTH